MNELPIRAPMLKPNWRARANILVENAARSSGYTADDIWQAATRSPAAALRGSVIRQLGREGCPWQDLTKVFGLHHSTVFYHLGRLNRRDRRRQSTHFENAQAANG